VYNKVTGALICEREWRGTTLKSLEVVYDNGNVARNFVGWGGDEAGEYKMAAM
jgi:hypothetical protein